MYTLDEIKDYYYSNCTIKSVFRKSKKHDIYIRGVSALVFVVPSSIIILFDSNFIKNYILSFCIVGFTFTSSFTLAFKVQSVLYIKYWRNLEEMWEGYIHEDDEKSLKKGAKYLHIFNIDSRYNMLLKAIVKKSLNEFMVKYPLTDIRIINYLIEINEKEIIDINNKIFKISNRGISMIIMPIVFSLFIDKFIDYVSLAENSEAYRGLRAAFVIILSVGVWLSVTKINSMLKIDKYSGNIEERYEFIKFLRERKFELLQNQCISGEKALSNDIQIEIIGLNKCYKKNRKRYRRL